MGEYDEDYDCIRGVSCCRFGLDGNCRSPISAATTDHASSGRSDDAMAKSARVSKLIGSEVYSADTSIGHIEDVLIDQTNVTAVILSVGGFLGIGDKLVAAPITAIKVGPEARFRTDLTKEQLTNAPAFDFGKLK